MKKLVFVAGVAVGFVLGSKMGREPYEKLEATARQYAEDPRVQEKVEKARESATKAAKDTVETVKAKAPEVANAAKETAKDKAQSVKEKAGSDGATDRKSASSAAGGNAKVGKDPLES